MELCFDKKHLRKDENPVYGVSFSMVQRCLTDTDKAPNKVNSSGSAANMSNKKSRRIP